jgi:hypothetical protein
MIETVTAGPVEGRQQHDHRYKTAEKHLARVICQTSEQHEGDEIPSTEEVEPEGVSDRETAVPLPGSYATRKSGSKRPLR